VNENDLMQQEREKELYEALDECWRAKLSARAITTLMLETGAKNWTPPIKLQEVANG